MAKVLKKLPPAKRNMQGRPSVWKQFADGQAWSLTLGVDTRAKSLDIARQSALGYAKRNGKDLSFRKLSDTEFAVQFT